MLYPKTNEHRQVMDLDGFWDFRTDAEDTGAKAGWTAGFPGGVPLAVPASWNDQLPDLRDFLGPAWYATSFRIPNAWRGGRLLLRFGSVNYIADAWLNGTPLGAHEGGHLPFSFDVTPVVAPGANLLVVRVDGRLAPDRVPPGDIPPDPLDVFPSPSPYPNTSFDFFPFCGIHRPVRLCRVPSGGIEEISVTTTLHGAGATVSVTVAAQGGGASVTARVRVSGHGTDTAVDVPLESGAAAARVPVSGPSLWSPESPALYDLEVDLLRDGAPFDSYAMRVGIRAIEVRGDQMLLNGKPWVVGAHVWNLCDFKTGQAVHRFGGMNLKGVFTRDRRPKMAAHALRRLWGGHQRTLD